MFNELKEIKMIENLFKGKNLRFIMFGGKGGVGKTSCAAATSVWAAEHLNKEILILSTDPAHSLSDSFNQNLSGGEVKKVQGLKNLYGLEINPQKEYAKYQDAMQSPQAASMPEEFKPFMEGMGDLSEMQNVMPPGADESFAFAKVLEFIENAEYDLIFFDTAPTGHTLRLLSLPEVLGSFYGKIIKMQMALRDFWGKFKGFFKRKEYETDTLAQMNKLQETIDNVADELKDPTKTSFVIVMIAEAMSIYETEDLISYLNLYEIPFSNIIVNMLFPEQVDCEFCSARRTFQQKHLEEIHYRNDGSYAITEVPLFSTEITGLERLKELSRLLLP
ncbi:MAG: arsenic-transporting ATPase [Candidatus Lokiarchaeota archaeon]|nr:arsenic-transporting ATPase [Candidatus Lokiarchaeota archaeon]